MLGEDHGQLTVALGDKLDGAFERSQGLEMEIVCAVDEQCHRPLGLVEKLLQIAFAPFRVARDRNGLFGGQVVERRGDSSGTDILAFSRLSARDTLTRPRASVPRAIGASALSCKSRWWQPARSGVRP